MTAKLHRNSYLCNYNHFIDKVMKLAYLISAHTDPEHLKRLISVLHSDADYYVHIDAKTDIKPFLELITYPYVHFIKKRINVEWGNLSEVKYQMALIKACLDSGINYDYIFFLSGLDYPLWSNESITKFLEKKPGFNYIQGMNLNAEGAEGYQISRPPLDWLKISDQHLKMRFRKLFRLGLESVGYRKKLVFTTPRKTFEVYKGSAWWCITPELASYVLTRYTSVPEIRRYFHDAFCPAETLIQTVAFNSRFKDQCILSHSCPEGLRSLTPLHYIHYDGYIRIFTEKNYDELIQSGKMFARKLVTGMSDKLMDMIDRHRAEDSGEKTLTFTE